MFIDFRRRKKEREGGMCSDWRSNAQPLRVQHRGGKHKARGPHPALHLVSTQQQHGALASVLSSYIYAVLKSHSAL